MCFFCASNPAPAPVELAHIRQVNQTDHDLDDVHDADPKLPLSGVEQDMYSTCPARDTYPR